MTTISTTPAAAVNATDAANDLSARVAEVLPAQRGLYWGGKWHQPHNTNVIQSINPSTGEALAEVLSAGGAEVDEAVGAARRAAPGWAAMPPLERGRCNRWLSCIGLHNRVGPENKGFHCLDEALDLRGLRQTNSLPVLTIVVAIALVHRITRPVQI